MKQIYNYSTTQKAQCYVRQSLQYADFTLSSFFSVFNRYSGIRRSFLCVMMCLIASFQLEAQTNAVWTQHPSFSNLNIGILSEDDTLHIRFSISTSTPEEEALKPKFVKITLPDGVTIIGVSDGTGSMGGTIIPGTVSLVGQECQIPITSMSYNTEVYLKVTLSANDCNAMTGSSNVYIAVLSDETPLITAFATLNVVRPDIIATPVQENSPTLANLSQSFTYSIPLSVSNGVNVQSMKITINKDQFTTLSNIKLGTVSITPVETTATSVVLDLTKDIVGATPISAAHPQTLQFTAQSIVRGIRKISATSVYPLENACITKNNLFDLTLSYTTVPGSVSIEHIRLDRMEVHPKTLASMPSAEDGTTTFYVEARRKNNGAAPAYILNMGTEVLGEGSGNGRGLGYISYLDTIYYKIGNGAVKAIDPSGYVYPDGYDLATSSPNYYKNLRSDNLFTSITPKKIRVEYRLPEVVPEKTEFSIYTPVRMGKIFDNSLWTEDDPVRGVDVIGLATPLNRVNGVHQTVANVSNSSAPLSYDANGEVIKDVTGYASYGIWINSSYFYSNITDMLIKAGEKGEVKIPFRVGTSNIPNYTATFYIQTPKWLEIEALSYAGTSTTPTVVSSGKYYNSARNTYYFSIKKVDGDVNIRYKPKPNGTGSGQYDYQNKNAEASIRYWVDWDLGAGKTGTAKDVNPVWDYFLKNIQQVTYFLKQEAVTMNSISLERQTRGLKVKGTTATQERTPVNGTTVAAVNDNIDHRTYLPEDIGHIKISAKVLGSGYGYLYMLIHSDSLNQRFDLALRGSNNVLLAFVNVNNTTKIFANEIQQSGDSACIRFPYTGGTSFPNNATLDITLPFKAKTMGHPARFQVYAEAYMAKTSIPNSLSPGADRYGQEYLTEQWQITYAAAPAGIFTNSGRFVTIADGTAKEYTTMSYDNGIQNNGHVFPNEYRPYKFPARLEIDMPAGIKTSQLRITASNNNDETSNAKNLLYSNPSSIKSNSDNTVTTYIYDIASKVDFNISKYTGTYTDLINAGKWIVPDDLYSILFYSTIQASRTAPNSGRIEMRMYFKDRLDNFTSVRSNANFAYIPFVNNSLRSKLTVSNNTFTVYDHDVSVPSVITGIESSTTHSGTRKAWLYVEGNVRNVHLQTKSGTVKTINAIGNGHWIPLDGLTINSPVDYTLNYTLNSMKTTGDSVRVHLVADFDANNWSPTTSAPVVVNDVAHFGGSEIIVTTPSTDSEIFGSFSHVPDTPVEYDREYTVEISASQTGEAILTNPEINLIVPAGQVLQTAAGKCQYQDVDGNWINIPAASLSYDSQHNSLHIKSSEFNSVGNFVLYKQASGKLNTLKVRLTFRPSCDTPLTGFNYYVSFDGKDLLGDEVEGMDDVNSKRIDPFINTNYYFSTSIHLPNGTAFGGDNKRDTLKVTVNKYSGDTYDISPTDSLEIKLPMWLNVTGAVKMRCENLSELNGEVDASYIREALNDNLRIIRIKLPSDVLNRAPQKGMNKPFIYFLPITYVQDTRNPALRDNPEQKIETQISMLVKFSPSCQNEISLSFGSEDKEDIALLTMESDNPYIYNMVSLDRPFNIRITSSGFLGGWYKDAALNIPLPTTDGGTAYTYSGTSTPDTMGMYIKPVFTQAYDSIRVTLHTSPVNLYWRTDAIDSVWSNPANWTTKISEDEDRKGYMPALITEVTLLSGADNYPVLTDTAACRTICFEHGAELVRQDLLLYDSARVQLKVQANRWYMFSPPLQSMYSGDFYLNNPDPQLDGQTAYTMLFNAENPETEYKTGDWTGAFNTPNVPLKPGSGLALWIDNGEDYDNHDNITFLFPKNDENLYTYNPDKFPPGNISGTYPTPRPYNGRFIYENGNGQIADDGNITLQDVLGHTDGEVFVGNPFMAHLNFNEFYTGNSGALFNNGYKLASGVTANGFIKDFYSYLRKDDIYLSTDPNDRIASGLIPPMQSFIISVMNGAKVTANIRNHTEMSTAKSDTFRIASQETTRLNNMLNILAMRGEDVSKAIVLQDETSTASYMPSEDSYKLFISKVMDSDEVLKSVQVYTRSSDGYALSINCIGMSEQDITIPLCIRTSEKGEIVLNFSGMESFGESTGIYLYDAQHPGRLIDLKIQPEYVFDKTEDELYLENRLSLVIGKALQPLGIETASESSAIRILSLSPHKLRIVSENGEALGAIRITDSWGRTLLDVPEVSSSVYEYQTPTPGIYIVRVGAEMKKVVSIR